MEKTIFNYTDPSALEIREDTSPKRALYLEQREPAPVVFEMQSEQAWRAFNELPARVLPPLPPGYTWTRVKNHYAAIRHNLSQVHEILIVLYGPNKEKEINFLCCIDGVTTYSLAHTATEKSMRRAYPMFSHDFKVPEYDYSKKIFKKHVRGHLIDHQDTIPEGRKSSTFDARNFVPEPPVNEWGSDFRSSKVSEIRSSLNGGVYVQSNDYGHAPLKTKNGTLVPEKVRFCCFDRSYQPEEVYHVSFEENFDKPSKVQMLAYAKQHLSSDLATMPVVVPYVPEQADRVLRCKVKRKVKLEQHITQGFFKPRFPRKDQWSAACSAGDFEFESAGRQLHAGILSSIEQSPASSFFFDRSRTSAEKLLSIDDKNPFKNKEIVEALHFFANDTQGQYDDVFDHFLQLWSIR